jgi:hypothetical protein
MIEEVRSCDLTPRAASLSLLDMLLTNNCMFANLNRLSIRRSG